jgi:hypothetical protein
MKGENTMLELRYIEEVCRREREKLAEANLDGPFIGILSMLPSLKNKISLLASQAYTLHNPAFEHNQASLGKGCKCKSCVIALDILSPTETEE